VAILRRRTPGARSRRRCARGDSRADQSLRADPRHGGRSVARPQRPPRHHSRWRRVALPPRGRPDL